MNNFAFRGNLQYWMPWGAINPQTSSLLPHSPIAGSMLLRLRGSHSQAHFPMRGRHCSDSPINPPTCLVGLSSFQRHTQCVHAILSSSL